MNACDRCKRDVPTQMYRQRTIKRTGNRQFAVTLNRNLCEQCVNEIRFSHARQGLGKDWLVVKGQEAR